MGSDVDDVGGHMDEQTQSGNARFRVDQRDIMIAPDRLRAVAQYKVALEHLQPFGADGELLVSIVLAWIDQRLSIADEIVAKREVIGIRGRPRRVERIDLDFLSLVFAKDLGPCQDHY